MITCLPEATREGTARLGVSYSQAYPSGGTPSTPRCLTRASGLTDRCCGCRRHDALVIPSASETIVFYRSANVTSNVNTDTSERHSKHPSLTPIEALARQRQRKHRQRPPMNALGRRTLRDRRRSRQRSSIVAADERSRSNWRTSQNVRRSIEALVPRKHISWTWTKSLGLRTKPGRRRGEDHAAKLCFEAVEHSTFCFARKA
ncbi:hypothetical protein LSAT2_022706 [Lamellibrachia satsuma]|nr:hypothetical protein LSAT2_022706 [Lamellibrachia satsuma]